MATAPTMRPPTRPPSISKPTNGTTIQTAEDVGFQWPEEPTGNRPFRIILSAVEGWGKTTAAAQSPDPIIVMAPGENGYETLYAHNRVPRLPTAKPMTWPGLLDFVRAMGRDPQGRKTIVLDAKSGFERMCHEYVCQRDFGGDWGDKGFLSFNKGYEVSVSEWLKLLSALEQAQDASGLNVLILSHVRVKPYKNPSGPDYDRFTADCHEKTWAPSAKWADAVFFGTFYVAVEGSKKKADGTQTKGKAIGGDSRILYTERSAAWDAKNRFGAPPSIDIPDDHSAVWSTIYQHIGGNHGQAE